MPLSIWSEIQGFESDWTFGPLLLIVVVDKSWPCVTFWTLASCRQVQIIAAKCGTLYYAVLSVYDSPEHSNSTGPLPICMETHSTFSITYEITIMIEVLNFFFVKFLSWLASKDNNPCFKGLFSIFAHNFLPLVKDSVDEQARKQYDSPMLDSIQNWEIIFAVHNTWVIDTCSHLAKWCELLRCTSGELDKAATYKMMVSRYFLIASQFSIATA